MIGIIEISLLMLVPLAVGDVFDVEVTPSWRWHFDNFVEDMQEAFTLDRQRLAELKIKHAENEQNLIDELERQNLPIPNDFEKRRVLKLQRAESVLTDASEREVPARTTLEDAIAKLKAIGELNEIRILHSQLPVVKNASPEEQERFNERVNALRSWQEFCTGEFDVSQFDNTKGSWEALKKRCKTLEHWENNFGFKTIRDTVIGGS